MLTFNSRLLYLGIGSTIDPGYQTDSDHLKKLVSESQKGKVDHNFRIWLLINLEVWYKLLINDWSQEQTRSWMQEMM